MDTYKITFIGAGNMATALIGGLVHDKFPAKSICASDVNDQKLTLLEEACGINTSGDNKSAISEADVIVLSVKPQMMREICQDIAAVVQQKQPLIISVAAGLNVENLSNWLGEKTAIVRAMPNTPALIKAGATGLFANEYVSQSQKEVAEKIMRAVGVVLWVDIEEHMDLITALSGSGPAYYFKIMESFEKAACEMGLPPETARLLNLQTALGAARLAIESDDTLSTLREKVTSPGGTTEKGLEALQEAGVEQMVKLTLQAAATRAAELAKEYGEN